MKEVQERVIMFYYNEKEIETTLRLYTTAKIKVNELLQFKSSTKGTAISEVELYLIYYKLIIVTVEKWIKEMSMDEAELIKLRFFDNLTFDAISIKLGYSNHSAVLKKNNEIIKRIKKRSFDMCIYSN